MVGLVGYLPGFISLCLPSTPSANPSAMSDTSNTASRLDELEMRAIHQDQTIDDLNAAITAQRKLILRLALHVARLADAEQSTSEAAPWTVPRRTIKRCHFNLT